MSSVRVAVRVRPFNGRERDMKSKAVIKMNKNATTIIDSTHATQPKTFTFDYSYWSHDGYKEDKDGLLVATSPDYADQVSVFNDLGVGVLNNAFEGYNSTLFAYGQTGTCACVCVC
jgi:hypothetical protein